MKHARKDYDRIQDPENKIPDDEPVFLIRGQDTTAPAVLRYWAGLAAGENFLIYPVDITAYLVQYWQAVIDQPVDYPVKEMSGATAEVLASGFLVKLALPEQVHQWLEVSPVQCDNVVLSDEYRHLARGCYSCLFVEHREVEDQEEVVLVLVYLGPLNTTETIVQVQGVERIVLGQVLRLPLRRTLDVDPGYVFPGQRLYVQLWLFSGCGPGHDRLPPTGVSPVYILSYLPDRG